MSVTEIEELVSAAFEGGALRRRELRLTGEQAEYIRTRWAAQVEALGGDWYQITFRGVEC